MALTYTESIPLGFPAPSFSLPDVVSGDQVALKELRGDRATVVLFICNHCPYVVHVRDELFRVAEQYRPLGVGFVGISSNDVERYPQDHPDRMKELAVELAMPFPYLFDESQEVAKAYHAACTPDLAVFDADLRCVYRGRFDDSSPGNDKPITGQDLRAALDAVLAGDRPIKQQWPSMGCNIKWKE